MKPASFGYVRPRSVSAAVAALAEAPDQCKVLAGGQSLVPLMNFRLAEPEILVDINDVEGLAGIRRNNGHVRVGATTRMRTLETSPEVASAIPLLAHAAHWVGHIQIRNRGTVGGSVAHADPAAEIPAMCLLLAAEITLSGTAGERSVRARDFFTGFLSTAAEPEELLTEITFPVPAAGSAWGFSEFAQRRGDFALAGAACVVGPDGAGARVVAFGTGDRPLRCGQAESVLRDGGMAPKSLTAAAEAAVTEVAEVVSARDAQSRHRLESIKPMVLRALRQAAERLQERQ